MMSKRSHIEYTGKEKGHTHTIVFRPSFSIAGRLRSCGNALLYIPFVTSAKLTGSSDAGGSFSKDGPCSWFLSSKSTWVSNKRWKVIRDMWRKLTSLTVWKLSQLTIQRRHGETECRCVDVLLRCFPGGWMMCEKNEMRVTGDGKRE